MNSKYFIINRYVPVFILCISISTIGSWYEIRKAKEVLIYNITLKNIPKDKQYNYMVYNRDHEVLSRGTLMEGVFVTITPRSLSSISSYYIKLGTESGSGCEPVNMSTTVDRTECEPNEVCDIIADLSETCDKEIYDLRVKVISPKYDDCDDDTICYNIGDKLIVSCSEKTKNKHFYLQWNIRKGDYYDHAKSNTSNNIIYYNGHFKMDLKRFDSGATVSCSAISDSGKILNTSSDIELKVIGEPSLPENMNTVLLESGAETASLDCGQGHVIEKAVASNNGTIFYCVEFIVGYNNTNKKKMYIIIARQTYNETIYYVRERETRSLSIGTVISIGVAVVLIVISIVFFTLYRRRVRPNIQDTIIYVDFSRENFLSYVERFSAGKKVLDSCYQCYDVSRQHPKSRPNEIVYAQLQMPESTSSGPRNNIDRPQYAEVIGILAPKQNQRNAHNK